MTRSLVLIPAAALAFGLTACKSREHADTSDMHVSTRSGSAPAQVLHDGDVRITATDNSVDLALIGDSISSGLSQSTLAKVKHDTDTGSVSGSGFGASIEKLVKSKVQSAIGTRVSFPLSAIDSATYEGGAIRFYSQGKTSKMFNTAKVNNRPLLESFTPADAQRFVDAVRARMPGAQAR